ncbi:MAG: hypothetical protein JNJ54_23695 [Myxococcaceae bacterium]|nr:hypothetical protein [Myxococcaceae bacterium]
MRTVCFSALLVVACGPVATSPPKAQSAVEPAALSLADVNPGSPMAGQQVGPTSFRGKVSGWYFTHTS